MSGTVGLLAGHVLQDLVVFGGVNSLRGLPHEQSVSIAYDDGTSGTWDVVSTGLPHAGSNDKSCHNR
eukprot:4549556-Amphidinium_carterae.1